MTLVRMNQGLGNQLSRTGNVNTWMDSWLRESENGSSVSGRSGANILEGEKVFEIQMAIPGYSKEDVQVKVENGLLTVSNLEKESSENEELQFVRREFSINGFERSFRLSRWVDQESISAKVENGVLYIEIPKKEEAIAKPSREIKIS